MTHQHTLASFELVKDELRKAQACSVMIAITFIIVTCSRCRLQIYFHFISPLEVELGGSSVEALILLLITCGSYYFYLSLVLLQW